MMEDNAHYANLELVRILTGLVTIIYAGSVGWLAALGETKLAYYGGLLTICSYGLIVFFTMIMNKRRKHVLRRAERG